MAIIRQRKKVLAFIGIGAVFFLIISGCAGGKSKNSDPESQVTTPKGPSPLYYDFGDVLIPNELKVNKKESFVYKTPGFSAGVLVLSGRVAISSLIAFFENNMQKDNWRIISSFKSPRTVMLFQKESRWCMINMSEDFKTYVEVWVAPTINEAEAGLLK
ncbi:MAG TPA: hypothetical protein VMW78_05645 [Anaerolineae bacterium]|nr:hypothetical protein [Anaerolineae bacterium]